MQSSYNRWWDGRIQWDKLSAVSRSFSRTIWLHVPLPSDSSSANAKDIPNKVDVIRMVHTLAVALKHHLRDERDWSECSDLKQLLAHLPNVSFQFLSRITTNRSIVRLHSNKPPTNSHPPSFLSRRVIPPHQTHNHRHPSPHPPLNPRRQLHAHHLRLRAAPPHPHPPRLQHRYLTHRMDLHIRPTESTMA